MSTLLLCRTTQLFFFFFSSKALALRDISVVDDIMQRDISFVRSMFVILKLPIFRRRSRRHGHSWVTFVTMMTIAGAIIILEPLFSNERNIYTRVSHTRGKQWLEKLNMQIITVRACICKRELIWKWSQGNKTFFYV